QYSALYPVFCLGFSTQVAPSPCNRSMHQSTLQTHPTPAPNPTRRKPQCHENLQKKQPPSARNLSLFSQKTMPMPPSTPLSKTFPPIFAVSSLTVSPTPRINL